MLIISLKLIIWERNENKLFRVFTHIICNHKLFNTTDSAILQIDMMSMFYLI